MTNRCRYSMYEREYQLNEKVVSALEKTIDEVVKRNIRVEENENES